MTEPKRKDAFGPWLPLSSEDLAILQSWGLRFRITDPKAEATVRVFRLQRWLKTLPVGEFQKLHADGKVGPHTAAAVRTMGWDEAEAAMLRTLGFDLPLPIPQQEPVPKAVPKGVIRDSTPLQYRRSSGRAERDTYFDNFPESDPGPIHRDPYYNEFPESDPD